MAGTLFALLVVAASVSGVVISRQMRHKKVKRTFRCLSYEANIVLSDMKLLQS
jgi:hypothetical protein